MSAQQWLGAALVALPFIGGFVWIARKDWRAALVIYGTAVGLVTLAVGIYLLTGGAS